MLPNMVSFAIYELYERTFPLHAISRFDKLNVIL